jgi:5-methylcytosine-specific restriction endonuclease McrA
MTRLLASFYAPLGAPTRLDRIAGRTYISLRCVTPMGAAIRSPCRHSCWVPERSPIGDGSGTRQDCYLGDCKDAMPQCAALFARSGRPAGFPNIRKSVVGTQPLSRKPTMAKSLYKYRFKAYQSQGGRCAYCGVVMWMADCAAFANRHGLTMRLARRLQCTAEHLKPRQDGGRNSFDNIAAACLACNLRRHARRGTTPTPEEYRAVVRNRVAKRAWHPTQVFERGLI